MIGLKMQMNSKEARELSDKYNIEKDNIDIDMGPIYDAINNEIFVAVNNGHYECYPVIPGCDKTWETIHKERELVKKHFTELGYAVESLGYVRSCMWDKYKISW